MASDLHRPNGQVVITPKNDPGFVESPRVKKFHGVGPATAERMKRGIETGLDLKSKLLGFLQQRFGKSGSYFYNIARGIDGRPVKSPTFTPTGITSNLLVRRDRDRAAHPLCFTFLIELGEMLEACFDMTKNHTKKMKASPKTIWAARM